MRKVPFQQSLKIIGRGSLNWVADRPIVVSFEVTDSCTCHCRHCDHGGPRDDSRNLRPSDYRRYMQALRPCVVQVSGGEPLLRPDLVEIVRNIKDASGLPYTILVSSWSLMTADLYVRLREAGIDQFSVSLDFPDDRHDYFRSYPGLYRHLEDLVPRMARLGHDDIVLNSCITSENLEEINAIADKAREWGVNLCYSAYSPRRTGCREFASVVARAVSRAEQSSGPCGAAPRRYELDRKQPQHAGCHPALLRGPPDCPVARPVIASWW